jgi:hypothetical protein
MNYISSDSIFKNLSEWVYLDISCALHYTENIQHDRSVITQQLPPTTDIQMIVVASLYGVIQEVSVELSGEMK